MTYDSEKIIYGKERIQIVELELDYCSNTLGVAPCTASSVGDAKCFNTQETTQDLPNYTVTGTTTGKLDLTVDLSQRYNRLAGSFITDGFKVGHSITVSGFPANANNNGVKEISIVTALQITITDTTGMSPEPSFNQEQEIVVTATKVYRFCTQRSPHPIGLSGVIPSIININVTPSQIDLKGGLGMRASASVTFKDHPHSDIDIDKYITERTWDASKRGTFWTKLRARNPNYQFRGFRILTGFLVLGTYDPANFQTQHFVIDRMDVGSGQATVTAKDPLKLASNNKAQAPIPNSGLLNVGITAGALAATLTPAGIGNLEYAASGFALIESEVVAFTRIGDALTLVRAQFNTTATAHSTNDTVQQCLEYSGGTRGKLDFIVDDLLINFANIDPNFVPIASHAAEVSTFLSGLLSGIIVKPMDVNKILKELSEAMPHYLWWDERAQEIQLTALKAPPFSANVLDMDGNLVKNSTRVVDKPDLRISTVFVSFGQINPTKRLDEIDNWAQTYARIDTDSISKFKSSEVKVINSRWIINTNKAAALQLAALIGRRFANIPREINFSLESKDSDVWLGQTKAINHRDMVDATGLPVDTMFQITSASESDNFNYVGLEYAYGEAVDGDAGGGDPNVDLVIISASDQNINLRTIYDLLFPAPDASTQAKFIVENGVIIGGATLGVESMDTGSWPLGAIVTLQTNSGSFVVGRGGKGEEATGAAVAEAGSLALLLNHNLTLVNSGVIGGGGGGGGYATDGDADAAGGGGAGNDAGLRGLNTAWNAAGAPDTLINPNNGTLENGGNGATIINTLPEAIAEAGDGGDLGEAGANGDDGVGGVAGVAIDKNGFTLTEDVTGDIRGSVIA